MYEDMTAILDHSVYGDATNDSNDMINMFEFRPLDANDGS